jgi:SPP1 gp7 family putative phage head morphogenesis protein
MNDNVRAALVNVIRAKRQNMSPYHRQKGIKPQRWLYPLATEARYAAAIRAWLKPMKDYVHTYLKENQEAILRGDSADGAEGDGISATRLDVIRLDAVPGKSFKTMIDSLNGWLGQYVPTGNEGVSGSPIYMGLGKLADSVFDFNEGQFEKGAKSVLGVEFPVGENWWPDARDTWAKQNYQLIHSDMQKYIGQINDLTEKAVTSGLSVKELAKQILSLDNKISKARANFIARDQIGKLNGQITQRRMEDVGLTMYIWETSGDERVRESHELIDGGLCRWDDSTVYSQDGGKTWINRPSGAVLLHPGMDYQCRCSATAYWQELVGEADEMIAQYEELDALSAQNIAAMPKPAVAAPPAPAVPEKKKFTTQTAPSPASAPSPQRQVIDAEKAITQEMGIIRKLGKTTGLEHLGIVRDNGTSLGTWKGKKDSITITNRMRKILNAGANNSLVIIHNHPNNTSFSLADLEVMSSYKSIKELRVVGHNGKTYSMVIGGGQRVTLDELEKFEKTIYNTVRTNVGNKTTMGIRTNYYSERNRLIAEHYGWTYEEGKLDGRKRS